MQKRKPHSLFERFWGKVKGNLETGCWEWTAGQRGWPGYGNFSFGPRPSTTIYAHRFAYRQLVGPIPPWLQIDHLCRNRRCVNPNHLELVTSQENIKRGLTGIKSLQKTHCPKGHPYSRENTYHDQNGWRKCRKCICARMREYRKRKT